jgi:hypothetical protein
VWVYPTPEPQQIQTIHYRILPGKEGMGFNLTQGPQLEQIIHYGVLTGKEGMGFNLSPELQLVKTIK